MSPEVCCLLALLTLSTALFFVGGSIQSFSFSSMSMKAQRTPSISSSIWQRRPLATRQVDRKQTDRSGTQRNPRQKRISAGDAAATHHVLLVLLEVRVDKEAAGGVVEGILHVVDALVPAGRQRGGSSGHLWEGEGRMTSPCSHTRLDAALLQTVRSD